jgi:NTP pyrophosphatase (non-canonical NTP hydrolase)
MTKDEYLAIMDERADGKLPANVLAYDPDPWAGVVETDNPVADAATKIRASLAQPCNWGDALDGAWLYRREAEAVLEALDRQLENPDESSSELTLNAYQTAATCTAFYPGRGTIAGLVFAALKLNGEAGEIAEKVGKILRDANGVLDDARRSALLDEAGDTLWYVAALANELNANLDDIATRNLAKLADRRARGVIGGDGDHR